MEEFMIGTAEDDNHLEDFLPKSLPEPLQPLIEYRIKLLMKTDLEKLKLWIQPVWWRGQVIKNKHVPHKYENIPISFESGGYIDRKYTGRVMIKLTNYSSKKVKLNSGSHIGYILSILLSTPSSNSSSRSKQKLELDTKFTISCTNNPLSLSL